MSSFEELFEELAKHNDRSVVFNDWLDYCIESNLIYNPSPKQHYHGEFEDYYKLMSYWLDELSEKLENEEYYDILGYFYEEYVQSRSKSKSLGQMYTPQSVTGLLSELTNINTGMVNDPTCGSGRTLLSAHVKAGGDVVCIGQDLDETSCKMAVLNFWSHGVRGSVLHMDTLEGTLYKAWRVNNYLYNGIPVPHIELVDERDVCNFIGLSLNNNDKSLTGNDKSLTVNDNKRTGTVQSTLW